MSEPAAGSEREEIQILSRMRVDPDFHRVQRQVTRDNMGYAIHRQELKKKDRIPAVRFDGSEEQTLPNSLIMRIMEDQQAENEADGASLDEEQEKIRN